MFLGVRELELRKIQFDVEFPPGEVDFNDRTLRQVTPMHAEGSAELLNNTLGEIRITGRMHVGMEVDCARCLEPVPIQVAEPFDLFYRPGPEESAHHEVALDEGETQIGFYEGQGLELGDVLREHVLLSMPMQQVCSEGCRGICPVCGANRNKGECGCEAKPADDRWQALRNLRETLGRRDN